MPNVGVGVAGLGQLAIGGWVKGQGELGGTGLDFLTAFKTRLDAVLAWRKPA